MEPTCSDLIGDDLCDLFQVLGYRIESLAPNDGGLWFIHAWRGPASYLIGFDRVLYRWHGDGYHEPVDLNAMVESLELMLQQARRLGIDPTLVAMGASLQHGHGGVRRYSFEECLRIASFVDAPLHLRYDLMELGVDVEIMKAHLDGVLPLSYIYDLYTVDVLD